MRWSAPRTLLRDHRLRCRWTVVRRRRDGRRGRRRRRTRPRAAQVSRSRGRGRCGCPRLRSAWWCRSPRDRLAAARRRVVHGSVSTWPTSASSPAPAGSWCARAASVVADLDTGFLHDGRPQRRMSADAVTPIAPEAALRTVDRSDRHPGGAARSSEHRVEGSDHPPLRPRDPRLDRRAAADRRPRRCSRRRCRGRRTVGAREGFAIGIGVNPWYGLSDPEHMAIAVVDEAIRNVVAVGADPDRVALLDNFSWGDPRRRSTLGELVAAVAGCCTAADLYRAPFVSGKDSLNNEYLGNDGQRHAVPPTLVITAVAHVPDADACITADLTAAGNASMLVGGTRAEFAGSHLDMVHGAPADGRRARPGPRPRALPSATGGSTGRSVPASSARATTSAKAVSPSPSPRCASADASARRSTPCRTTMSPPPCSASRSDGSWSRSNRPTSTPSSTEWAATPS